MEPETALDLQTIAVYVVHDLNAAAQQPMAFPTLENATAYADANCSDDYNIFTVPVVRYATYLHPVEVLMRPTASPVPQGALQEEGPVADDQTDGAVSAQG